MDSKTSEGAYIMMPKEDDTLPHQYSKLDQDVLFQKGKLVDQWTINYNNMDQGSPIPGVYEQAIIKVRFSDTFKDIIEFEVELAPVPVFNDR